jgi:tousled-like kinase
MDPIELKELLTFKLSMLAKEEGRLKEELMNLEKEKTLHIVDCKRLKEEESAKLAVKKHPILKDKYLVLSILAKGSHSEIYKVFDLEMCREMALKLYSFEQK